MPPSNARLKKLAGLMARQLAKTGSVDVTQFTAKHGGAEFREPLTQVLEMLEVWRLLDRQGRPQAPTDFAAGYGETAEIAAAFAEAATTWKAFAPDADEPPAGESAAPAPDAGRVVAGQSLVSITRWIGAGGTALVGEGTDVVLGRQVAVKTPNSPDYASLTRDVQLVGHLVHANIPAVHSLAFDKDGQPSFIMPLLDGVRFDERIAAHHDAKPSGDLARRGLHALLRHVVTAARALAHAHRQTPAIIHRDVKPQNILFDRAGNAYLADWGHGYRADHLPDGTPGFGTMPYAAPEQWAGTTPRVEIDVARLFLTLRTQYDTATQKRVMDAVQAGRSVPDALAAAGITLAPFLQKAGYDLPEQLAFPGRAADVYSLGATAYHAVTGVAPFGDAAADQVPPRKARNLFTPPRTLAPHLPAELAAVVEKALATKPEDRYHTAADFADDLERAMGRLIDEPVTAFKPGEEPVGVRVRRRVRRYAGTAALLLALFGLTGLVGLSCSAERHLRLRATEAQAETAIRTERTNAAEQRKLTVAQAEREVGAARDKADARVAAEREKVAAERTVERDRVAAERAAERDKAADDLRKLEAEASDLRRRVARFDLRDQRAEKVRQAQAALPRPLTAEESTAVDRAARRFELDLATADAERLRITRPESAELSALLRREAILRETGPPAGEPGARPEFDAAERRTLDLRGQALLDEPPQTKAAKELRRQLATLCEHDPAMRKWVLDLSRTPGAYNEATRFVHDAVYRMENGNLPGGKVPPAMAGEWATGRQAASDRFLLGRLSGKSFEECLKDARTTAAGELVDPAARDACDRALARTVADLPSDAALLDKMRDHPPAVFNPPERFRPDGFDPPGGVTRAPDPAAPRPHPPGGVARAVPPPPQPKDFKPLTERVARASGGAGVPRADFALSYEDLAPARQTGRTTLHDGIVEQQLRSGNKPLPPAEVARQVQLQKGIGSPKAAAARSYSFTRMQGFHRVGGADLPPVGELPPIPAGER